MNESLVRHVLFPLHERLKRKPTFRWLAELERTQWLSPEQLRQYEEWRKFEVTGSGGGRYLITPAYIHVLNTGQHICFVPENFSVLPTADIMLARKIALENDEAGALKVAYRLPY